jgi:hypothetical protein
MSTCRACKYACVTGFDVNKPFGACRRNPPQALSSTESTFPIVHLDNFSCGEFSRSKGTAHPTPKKAGIKERK